MVAERRNGADFGVLKAIARVLETFSNPCNGHFSFLSGRHHATLGPMQAYKRTHFRKIVFTICMLDTV